MKFIIDHEKIKGEKIGTIDPVIIKDPNSRKQGGYCPVYRATRRHRIGQTK